MSELPPPLTPPECDLRGLPFMPLDVVRLMDSDLYALSSGEEFKAAVSLWCKAWGQAPAASLPNSDKVLAHLSGAGSRWPKVREMALRGFVLCSDGRWYHPIIAEKALEALPSRQAFRERKSSDAERKARERADRKELFAALRGAGIVPAYDTPTRDLRAMAERDTVRDMSQEECDRSHEVTDSSRDTSRLGQGQGQGQGQKERESAAASDSGETHPPRVLRDANARVVSPSQTPEKPQKRAGSVPFEGAEIDAKTGRVAVNGWFWDVVLRDVYDAAGIDEARWTGTFRPLVGWLLEGIDPDETIVPTVKRIAGRPDYRPPSTLQYFDRAVREAHARRAA